MSRIGEGINGYIRPNLVMGAQNTYVAILAGGVGSRFWPASREERPKQFLDIAGSGKSLLQLTFERFQNLCPTERIFIVTHRQYAELVQEQLPGLDSQQIICEPGRNNTAPCIAYTGMKIHALNPEANLVVAPSDHLILQEGAFLETLREALDFSAANNALVTLGIKPLRPDTGYGYIQTSPNPVHGKVHQVIRFAEKPPMETARTYLASGDYLWNAGIFIWRTRTVLEAFRLHAPDIFTVLDAGKAMFNTPMEESFISREYLRTPSISVDYAIMEKAKNVYTLPGDFGWSDLGTWASLYAESPKGEGDNVNADDRTLLYQTTGCLFRKPQGKMLVVKDLHGYMIIDEGDVLLIHPLSKEQELRAVSDDARKI